jgi:pimeloyl-ACP methyl ester carboxylesterase
MPIFNATDAPTDLAEINQHTIAYRSIGTGTPFLLCQRFRGHLDHWDPAFLDELAKNFRVIIFDYAGCGNSSGAPGDNIEDLANDGIQLVDALGIDNFVVGGWSLGGLAAQHIAMLRQERVTHLVLFGTIPIRKATSAARRMLYEHATLRDNDPEHEVALFFGDTSDRARRAAEASRNRIFQRIVDRSPYIRPSDYADLSKSSKPSPAADRKVEAYLKNTNTPVLAIAGDHDIIFPVARWFEVVVDWKSLHLLVLPQAGHAPHHKEPEFCAEVTTRFVKKVG